MVWFKELKDLGYVNTIPWPLSHAIQATIGYIKQPEVHTAIVAAELASIEANKNQAGSSKSTMDILGIDDWTAIWLSSVLENTQHGITMFGALAGQMETVIENNKIELEKAQQDALNIGYALTPPLVISLDGNEIEVEKVNPTEKICSNPLIALEYFNIDEQCSINRLIDDPNSSQTGADDLLENGDFFVPSNPLCFVEYDVSKASGTMWKIHNINQHAPISVNLWTKWANLKPSELQKCHSDAINFFKVQKFHILTSTWPMSTFKGKYKCVRPAQLSVKMELDATSNRTPDHKSKLWNWHRWYLRCECTSQDARNGGCGGQIIWFDHAMWYIANHMHDFFEVNALQGRFASFIVYIGGVARNGVLAQVSFMFLREYMLKATLEFHNNQATVLLPAIHDGEAIQEVERLIKPASFTEMQKASNPQTPQDRSGNNNEIFNEHMR